jgi:DNA-binding MarR family transcriptional regulator
MAPNVDDVFNVGPLIGRVRVALLMRLDAELQPFGLTSTEFSVLKNLTQGAAETAADLCRMLHYDTGAMTRTLDRLEKKHLIRRQRSRNDRRVVSLTLTSTGLALLPRLLSVATRVFEDMLAGFTAAEIANLKLYLNRLIENGQAEKKHI